jgi:hypothetical protein
VSGSGVEYMLHAIGRVLDNVPEAQLATGKLERKVVAMLEAVVRSNLRMVGEHFPPFQNPSQLCWFLPIEGVSVALIPIQPHCRSMMWT